MARARGLHAGPVERDPARDPQFDGLYWSIDPDTPDEQRHQAHATAALVALYLKARPNPPAALEFIAADPQQRCWLVRWPNGSMRWETETSLTDRGFVVPQRAILQPGIERDLLVEADALERARTR